jgi:hypothetical protein
MEPIRKILGRRWVLWAVIVVGLAARLLVATRGHNYDMDSWNIVADITAHGGNVYAETGRYNYGPVWFLVLHALDVVADHRHAVLRYLVAGFLSLADVGICLLLCRLAGRLAGMLFFLNPVSILITGFHGQFDNLAILMALGSVWWLGDDFDQPVNRRKFCGLLLLGLSLMTKHLFFAFPFWLAVKQKGWGQKLIVLFVPVACFLSGFVPYWSGGGDGIISHVFCYETFPANYFYNGFVPGGIQRHCDSQTLWLALLLVFAFVCRTRGSLESLLLYSGLLVALAPAAGNQYLAIPMALAAVYPGVLFGAYVVAATFHICAQVDGPQWIGHGEKGCLWLAVDLLCWAVAWRLWRPQILQLVQNMAREFQVQVGWPK